jgi:hypothetical protein
MRVSSNHVCFDVFKYVSATYPVLTQTEPRFENVSRVAPQVPVVGMRTTATGALESKVRVPLPLLGQASSTDLIIRHHNQCPYFSVKQALLVTDPIARHPQRLFKLLQQ